MTVTGARDRQAVEAEMVDVAARRAHANDTTDFEAYAHLSEQEADLLDELARLLPGPRPATG